MNSDQLKGSWRQLRGKIQEKWGELTDDDLDVIGGRLDQLVGRVQQKYGLAREAAEREVNQWMAQTNHEPEMGSA
jgi:uncharacterized protein YjbJ (UPF0337 family)